MKALLGILTGLALAGCAPAQQLSACPPGQERLRTAQLFLGRSVDGRLAVADAAFREFVDQELTPRFPDGLTVMEGGGAWGGAENGLIRQSSKVVLIVLPKRGDAGQRVAAARAAYKARFKQDLVLLISQPACVSF